MFSWGHHGTTCGHDARGCLCTGTHPTEWTQYDNQQPSAGIGMSATALRMLPLSLAARLLQERHDQPAAPVQPCTQPQAKTPQMQPCHSPCPTIRLLMTCQQYAMVSHTSYKRHAHNNDTYIDARQRPCSAVLQLAVLRQMISPPYQLTPTTFPGTHSQRLQCYAVQTGGRYWQMLKNQQAQHVRTQASSGPLTHWPAATCRRAAPPCHA